MDNNERNEHFKGFARILMQEVDEKNQVKAQSTGHYLNDEELHLLITQRAYDLVYHAVSQLDERANTNLTNIKAWIDLGIPDLTEWPKTVLE